jgi:hypothetical protein
MLSKGVIGAAAAANLAAPLEPGVEGEPPGVGLAAFQRSLAMEATLGTVAPTEGPPSDPAMVTVLVQTAMQGMDAGRADAWAKMDGDTVIVRWRFKADKEADT